MAAAEPDAPRRKAAEVAWAELLAEVELLRDIPAPLLAKLEKESAFKVIASGATIFDEHEFTDDFYVILDGRVGGYRGDNRGGFQYVTTLARHEWFGEMSAISTAPRALTMVAEEESVVLRVPRGMFSRLYGDKSCAAFRKCIDALYGERVKHLLLRSVMFLRAVPDPLLRRLAQQATFAVVEPDGVVVREGEEEKGFHIVRAGNLKVVRREQGREKLVAYLSDNSSFGELALVRKAPSQESVIALTRCDLVSVPSEVFAEVMAQSADFRETVRRRIEEIDARVRGPAATGGEGLDLMVRGEYLKAGKALVIDLSKCTHCNMCIEGCIEAHEDRVPRIGKRGQEYGPLLLTSSCFDCTTPECMLACKLGAITRGRDGQVHIEPLKCTGCKACEPACPFGTIHMQDLAATAPKPAGHGGWRRWLSTLPLLRELLEPPPAAEPETTPSENAPAGMRRSSNALAVKCDSCHERGDMACIYNCPCGAILRMDPRALLG